MAVKVKVVIKNVENIYKLTPFFKVNVHNVNKAIN